MIRLVVTADDVGLAEGLTRGALGAHDGGIVTACSIAANGRALPSAIAALRGRPELDCGVHLVLTGERPLSPASEIPSLVRADGALHSDFRAFAMRYAWRRIRLAEVELELRRQIERLAESGIPLVHANSHQHLHLLPGVFDVVARLAAEHGIRFLRIPAEPKPGFALPRGLELRVLNALGRRARRTLSPPLLSLERTPGIADAGHLNAARLAAALESIEHSMTAELVCHPGLGDGALAEQYGWAYGWEAETKTLSAPGLRERLGELGIRLSSFREL